jgi:hypothetical protein
LFSIEKLRRAKEALISVALRLQVAIKVAKEDEQTLSELQTQAERSKCKELEASKRAEEASALIRALSIEVNALKRKLKIYEQEKSPDNNDTHRTLLSIQQHHVMNEEADQEVDGLLQSENFTNSVPNFVSETVVQNASPFDKWKMSQLLYAPDTPAASLQHDKHVVEMLMEASTQALIEDLKHKQTKSSIAKMRNFQKRITNEQESLRRNQPNTLNIPANEFETIKLEAPELPIDHQNNRRHEQYSHNNDSAAFFLGHSPEQRWGNQKQFEHENLGRLNLWTMSDQRAKKTGKLKSLRREDNKLTI